jgi:hypothetical protein
MNLGESISRVNVRTGNEEPSLDRPVVSTRAGEPAGREAPSALQPSELIVVSGVALFLILLTAWCLLRVTRQSLLSEGTSGRGVRGRSTSRIDPWVEAGRRAQPVDPQSSEDRRENGSGNSDPHHEKPHG